jgi:AhpD family alkylhydroperoxidase
LKETTMNRHRFLSTLFLTLLALLGFSASAFAETPAAAKARADVQSTLGFVPDFIQRIPEPLLPGAWEELKTLQLNPKTALDGRTKELIGLAVAAQIPCRYCIIAHTEFAKLNGARDAEIGEAVGMAAITRHWSTFLNGAQIDETRFRADIAKLIENARRASASKTPMPASVDVVDGASAVREMNALLGFAPEFLQKFPAVARSGAWKQMRDLQLNPKTALTGKQKELIGLAVSSQVPCRYCIVAHTEFAKLNGATEAEIGEAIAMASVTRSMSTVLNGVQLDEARFRRDVDRLVRNVKSANAAKGPVAQR